MVFFLFGTGVASLLILVQQQTKYRRATMQKNDQQSQNIISELNQKFPISDLARQRIIDQAKQAKSQYFNTLFRLATSRIRAVFKG